MPDRYEHITDEQLLNNFYNDRNNQWLGILLERYTLLLYGVSMKYLKDEDEAKDAVQQVFLKAITELHKYPVQYFKSWLYMVAKNHCLMRIRQKQGKLRPILPTRRSQKNDPLEKHQHIEKDKSLN